MLGRSGTGGHVGDQRVQALREAVARLLERSWHEVVGDAELPGILAREYIILGTLPGHVQGVHLEAAPPQLRRDAARVESAAERRKYRSAPPRAQRNGPLELCMQAVECRPETGFDPGAGIPIELPVLAGLRDAVGKLAKRPAGHATHLRVTGARTERRTEGSSFQHALQVGRQPDARQGFDQPQCAGKYQHIGITIHVHRAQANAIDSERKPTRRTVVAREIEVAS